MKPQANARHMRAEGRDGSRSAQSKETSKLRAAQRRAKHDRRTAS